MTPAKIEKKVKILFNTLIHESFSKMTMCSIQRTTEKLGYL